MKVAGVFVALACSGCVPMPNTRTSVPSVHGRVVSAKTGEPVDLAAVMIDGHKETTVMTGRDGAFATDPLTQSSFFRVWNPFAGDPVQQLGLRVVRPGFAKHKQKVEWHTQSQTQVHLAEAIRLEDRTAEETAREVLSR